MREIESSQIQKAVKKLAIDASYELEPDILNSLKAAEERETSNLARSGLAMLLPIRNDTGSESRSMSTPAAIRTLRIA